MLTIDWTQVKRCPDGISKRRCLFWYCQTRTLSYCRWNGTGKNVSSTWHCWFLSIRLAIVNMHNGGYKVCCPTYFYYSVLLSFFFFGFRDSWAAKVRELLPYIACHHLVCMTSVQEYFGDAKVLILSYSIMEKNVNKILEKKFGCLILVRSGFFAMFFLNINCAFVCRMSLIYWKILKQSQPKWQWN